MLSARKNKSPAAVSHSTGAWRVNADQMHGSIYISRTNITLPDQANRQGIVETEEFRILQDFLRNIIKYFEQDRQAVCRKLNTYFEKMHPTAEIEKELDDKIKKDVQNKERSKRKNTNYSPEFIEVNKVSALVDKKDSTIKQLETELQMLRVLATTGIVTNTYIHEIKGITHKLGMKITMAKEAIEFDKDLDAAYKYILEANKFRSFFTSWFKVTVESVRRDKRTMRTTDVSKLASELVSSWNLALSPKNIIINCSVEKQINLKCFPYELESILNNLISNSAASFETTRRDEKKIDISIESTDTGIMILYSDSGIGLINPYKENPRLILEPFESEKRSANGEIIGTGMGMWIINFLFISKKNASTENRIFTFVVILVMIIVFVIFHDTFFLLLYSVIKSMGIESRTLDKLVLGSFTTSLARNAIYENALNIIKINPLIPKGIGYMTTLSLTGIYTFGGVNTNAHNIVLELLIEYGVVIGSIIFLVVLNKVIRSIKFEIMYSDNSIVSLSFCLLLQSIIQLFFSSSLYESNELWIGLVLLSLTKYQALNKLSK